MSGSKPNNVAYEPRMILFVIMALVTVGVYFPICAFNFNLSTDDYHFVLNNPSVRDASLEGLWSVLTRPGPYYNDIQPIAFLSLWIDHFIYGIKPFGYYLTQILLHLLNLILVFLVIKAVTGNEWLALLCAFILGAHPLGVDTVAVISQRKTLLANLFGMACLLYYTRWRVERFTAAYGAAVLFLVLSLLSKAHWICLPALMLVVDYSIVGKVGMKDLRSKIPFFAISGGFAIVTFISVKAAGQVTPYHFGTFHSQMIFALLVYSDYVHSFLWPVGLSPAYTYHPAELYSIRLVAAIAIIGAMGSLTYLSIKKGWREILFGVCWFTLGILPNVQIVPTLTVRADRYMYHAMTGLSIALIGLLLRLAPRPRKQLAAMILFVLIPVLLGPATLTHLGHYSNSVRYVQRFIDTQGWAPSTEIILGRVYALSGQYEKAARSLRIVVDFYQEPHRSKYRYQLAYVYIQMGKWKDALKGLNQISPENPLKKRAEALEKALEKNTGRDRILKNKPQ